MYVRLNSGKEEAIYAVYLESLEKMSMKIQDLQRYREKENIAAANAIPLLSIIFLFFRRT